VSFKIRKGPDGVHLFERRSGTNILLDEVIPPKPQWTFSPRQVSIALTNTCDLACSHCYAPKFKASLNKERLKRWLLELDEAGCFGIGFGGGEPTLYPGLVEICQFAQRETGLAISLTTHGQRLNQNLITQLKENVNFIRISMDGVGATYEAIRGRKFPHLLNILGLLRGQMSFGINYVVNDQTMPFLTEAAEVAEKYEAKELLLLPEVAAGKGTEIDTSTLERLQYWVKGYRGSLKLSVSAANRDSFACAEPLELEPDYVGFAHIEAGSLLKTSSFETTGVKIDNDGIIAAYRKLTSNEYIV
jgi:MoaA/NifB/PqqE/SkfB family radical SAM enzyme